VRTAVTCASKWAAASPPLWAGQAAGGGVPVAPVGDGLGLGDGDADGDGDARAMVALAVAADVGGPEVGVSEGVTVGAQAPPTSTIRSRKRLSTFVV